MVQTSAGWLTLGSLGMNDIGGLPAEIDELWENRGGLTPEDAAARKLITAAVDLIKTTPVRCAWPGSTPGTDQVVVDDRAKRAILLAFRVMPMEASQVGEFRYHDRVPLTSHLEG